MGSEKRAKQQMYRELLNTQIQYQQEMKGYGNMTELEKKLNRVELQAYKHYDKNVYSLVPGVNSQPTTGEQHWSNKYPSKARQVAAQSMLGEDLRRIDTQQQRLQALGNS